MSYDDYLIIGVAAVPAIAGIIASSLSIFADFNHNRSKRKNHDQETENNRVSCSN